MTADLSQSPKGHTPVEHEAYSWVLRFVSGDAGPMEVAALKEWSSRSPEHRAAFDRASKTWKALDPARQSLLTAGTPDVRPDNASAGVVSLAPSAMRRRAFLGGALAASAAGVAVLLARPPAGLWPSWSELAADYRTETGERRQIMLAGNTSVDMNTQTSIALRSSADALDRIELISGEAIVTTPATLGSITVMAANGRIVAAQARFNVRRDGRTVSVTCLDGSVRIERAETALALSAGRQTIYSAEGTTATTAIDPAVVAAWNEGIVIFDGTPIAEVVTEINRYRPGKIILINAALGRERFNARFRIENIDRVVNQIVQIFGVSARALPGGITLLG